MAWEWLAPTAAVAGALVGAVTTAVVAHGGRKHAESVAREERQQQRFADAYVQLLRVAVEFGQWAASVRPMFNEGQEIPPLPSRADQAQVEALVGAYGSVAVSRLHQEHRDAIRAIIRQDMLIGIELQDGKESGLDKGELWRELDMNLRPRERETRCALVEQVARELSRHGKGRESGSG